MPTFTRLHAELTPSQSLWSNTIGVVALMLLIPLFGSVSDRVGRKPLLLASCAAFVVLLLPLSGLILGQARCSQALDRRRLPKCSVRWVDPRG